MGGVFGALQGSKIVCAAGSGRVRRARGGTYTDPSGTMWVSGMRHAGVVYDPNGPIVARGKKLYVNGKYLVQGNTMDEGYIDTTTDAEHLMHINAPYNPGDVLMIAADGQGADKIIPTMTYEVTANPQRNDAQLNGIGISNGAAQDVQRLLAAHVSRTTSPTGSITTSRGRGRGSWALPGGRNGGSGRRTGRSAPTPSADRSTPRRTEIRWATSTG